MSTQKNNSAAMPEVLEFLKTTRTLVNQINILKHINIPKDVKQTIKTAIQTLFNATKNYKEGDNP